MRRFLLALAFLLGTPLAASAQTGAAAAPADTVGVEMPLLVGGLASLVSRMEYPPEAEADGVEGRVVVTFVVTEGGTVEDAEVTVSVHPALDRAALTAVERARFVPAHRDGRPIRVRLALPITFDLPEGTR